MYFQPERWQSQQTADISNMLWSCWIIIISINTAPNTQIINNNNAESRSINVTHTQGEENRTTQVPYGKGEPLPTRTEESTGSTTNLDTTTFVDDGAVVSNDTSHFVRINEIYFKNSDNMVSEQSVIDFLKKPIVLTNGSFSTTDTFTFLNFYDLPYAALTSSQGLLWMQKLAFKF